MRNTVKKAVSLIMIMLLAASSLVIKAFGADAETVRQYGSEGGYLAIGDSISRGCGAE